jgi:nucleotide-binding universal stress UspA family protein
MADTSPRPLKGGFAPRIFHPTDFSPPSEVAFLHALKLALVQKGALRIMHIGTHPRYARWGAFPQVRTTLARWGVLPSGSAKAAVPTLGLDVQKVAAAPGGLVKKILGHLENEPADLVVLATHHRRWPARWMTEAVAEPLVRSSTAMTLLIPPTAKGFVTPGNGKIRLERILIPVDVDPDATRVVQAVDELCTELHLPHVAITLLHVGDRANLPPRNLSMREGQRWNMLARDGDVVEEILGVASDSRIDLIAMATQGHKGILDALRGSTTERVVRDASCPVLAVPANLYRDDIR